MVIEERRKYPRHACVTLFDIAHKDRFFYDYSVNLGEGGLYLETKETMQPEDKVLLRFTLPGYDHVFESEARVQWVNPKPISTIPKKVTAYAGAGISFIQVPEKDVILYKEFLAKSIASAV